jgi:hypothetical protein
MSPSSRSSDRFLDTPLVPEDFAALSWHGADQAGQADRAASAASRFATSRSDQPDSHPRQLQLENI